jgi:hypothetical protein
MATTVMNDIDYARWFLALKLFNDEFNTEFLMSVAKTETPSEKQLVGLSKCVAGLKMVDKLKKYNLSDHSVYFGEEIDFSDLSSNDILFCSETNLSVEDDEILILNDTTKRFIKPSQFKKDYFIKTPTKKKLVLSSL